MNDNEKICVDSLWIEVTRKCNLACKHCFRGESETLDLNDENIDRLFELVKRINCLFITGGEPSMNTHGVNKIVENIKEKKIKVGFIFVITNGRTPNIAEFLKALEELQKLCDYPERSVVMVSVDQYHGFKDAENNIADGARLLKRLRKITSLKLQQQSAVIVAPIKKVGRAAANDLKAVKFITAAYPVFIHEDKIKQLYLTAKGDLGTFQEFTFKDEDIEKNQICNISEVETGIELINKIKVYNNRDHVRIIGKLLLLAGMIVGCNCGYTACTLCEHYINMFPKVFGEMESIIASDDFQALDDEVKEDLLKYVTWDLYKNNKTEKVDNLGEICPWWNITPLNKSRMQYYITMGKNLFKMASSKK